MASPRTGAPRPGDRRARSRPSLQGIADLPARDRAYHDLRYRILTGRLAPGTTLLETELAALLSLSRTPVREATIRLAEEGLIAIRPRHGITVRSLTLNDVRDILDVLSALEIRAVELVARRGLARADHDRLLHLMDRMERATEAGDIAQWSEMDDDFHSTVAGLCGNDRLLSTLDEYWSQQYRPRMMIVPLRPKPTQSNIEHRRIVEALAAGDVEAARLAQQQHRARADRQQLDLLRDRLADGADRA
ncbi:GntR family transcriptional regulator [Paracoccus zhejiangensis]|uniref:GntR family transcriptional regulator n=1 Tax=Paracoccus zhejiangensis TaxID=1077935 RepID=UPI0018E3FD21|nr:GntR family transcriptional regulator [Paracoccus zhejiangensis]